MISVMLAFAQILVMACDVAGFFLTVRLVRKGFSSNWLEAFDAAGRGIVDGLLSVFDRFAEPKKAGVREEVKILAWMLGLLLARVALTETFS